MEMAASTSKDERLADAGSLAEPWSGLAALVVHDGVFHATGESEDHVLDA